MSTANHHHHRLNRFQRISMERLLFLFVTMTILSVLLTMVHHYNLPPHSSSTSSSSSSTNINHDKMMMMIPPRQQQQQQQQHYELLWKNNDKAIQVEKKNNKGRIVHHSITHLNAQDFQDLGEDAATAQNQNLTLEQASQGRQELIAILQDAGVQDMDPAAIIKLPTWKQVTDLYGTQEGPIIYGLDTCDKFRKQTPSNDISIGTAGLFNTGTNPLSMYLQANCEIPTNINDKYKGMRWQVPWGKHMLASRKWTNTAAHETKTNKTNVLPVVLIRDPYSWMQSMCKHPYGVKWFGVGSNSTHCPNLVPTAQDLINFAQDHHEHLVVGGENTNVTSTPVTIPYPEKTATFDSMVHFWSTWYNEYLHADYPRLIIRFEDLIFHQRELISTVCQCVGAVAKQEHFSYVVGEAKWGSSTHAGSSNMISAMIKYGTDHNRFKSLTPEDMAFASTHIDPELMQLFQYAQPPLLEKAPSAASSITR